MATFTPKGVAIGFGLFVGILFFLYWFLVGLDLLGNAFKLLAGDSAGSLFGSVDNPVAGLMVGILATVLVQSSSTTTSIIVAAAGAGVLPVSTGIPMVFGANIGTSVTNTIVSLGFVGDREQYRRGFAGATVHDMFNYLNVILWLPLECITSAINHGNGGVLYLLTAEIAKGFSACEVDCEDWEGPLKVITEAIAKKIISVDKDVIKDFAYGKPSIDLCTEFLCTIQYDSEDNQCADHKFSQKRCAESEYAVKGWCGDGEKKAKAAFNYCIRESADVPVSQITVNQSALNGAIEHFESYKLNKGGCFYDAGLSSTAAGWVSLILSLTMLIVSLLCMVKLLGIAIRGTAEDVLKKALNMNGYLAIVVGCGVTMFVQSSSITTSSLTPLVALGTLSLEGMLPLTLGANIGTTLTGVLASLVGSSADGFQLAMCHVFFNVFGTLLFYPIPRIRALPLGAARRLGDLAATFKAFPIFYIIMLFLFYPGFFLGISIGFNIGGGSLAGSIVGLLVFVAIHIGFFFWYFKRDGEAVLVRRFGFDEDTFKKPEVQPSSASNMEINEDVKVQPSSIVMA